jgi:hypothetical protein
MRGIRKGQVPLLACIYLHFNNFPPLLLAGSGTFPGSRGPDDCPRLFLGDGDARQAGVLHKEGAHIPNTLAEHLAPLHEAEGGIVLGFVINAVADLHSTIRACIGTFNTQKNASNFGCEPRKTSDDHKRVRAP